MTTTNATHWFPDHLQNELTAGTAALLRAWIAEACRINGSESAEWLAETLAFYVVLSMDEKDLHGAPRDSAPLPTVEELAAMMPQLQNLEPS